MKNRLAAALIALVVVITVGCGGEDARPGAEASETGETSEAVEKAEARVVVTQEEAEEAFAVSFAAVMFASFQSAFGEAPAGATLSDDNLVLTLEKMALSDFAETAYTHISGTASNNGEGMDCDLVLEGGPVQTIQYTFESFDSDVLEADVVVNGEEMSLVITEDTFGG